MWFTKVGAPVSAADRKHRQLCDDDCCADGGCDFFGCFDAETNVTFAVANYDNGLEASPLTGTGLLLDGFDLK